MGRWGWGGAGGEERVTQRVISDGVGGGGGEYVCFRIQTSSQIHFQNSATNALSKLRQCLDRLHLPHGSSVSDPAWLVL